ncbi:MAG: hypothetical protein ABIT37_01455 [Luteolibacter sp.]
MRIRINSRNLNELQQARIEGYFLENFSFSGKMPTLIWKDEDSEFILLGYAHRTHQKFESHDASSIMFRVHENELLGIAGRMGAR